MDRNPLIVFASFIVLAMDDEPRLHRRASLDFLFARTPSVLAG
jgi:hypothetical protein